MKKMVLIGGGNIGRADTLYETKEIDEKIVSLTNKENPNFLFIGLASSFSDSYYKVIKDIYKNLGCVTGKISNKTLKNSDVVKNKISSADIIYIGGGDTLLLMNILKDNNMISMLNDALNNGCVIAGISAGAIACFKEGLSDTEILNKISNNYVLVEGAGFMDGVFVPHFDTDSKKKEDLIDNIKNSNKKAICLDNGTALVVNDTNYEFVRSIPGKSIKTIYFENDKLIEKEIDF